MVTASYNKGAQKPTCGMGKHSGYGTWQTKDKEKDGR